MPFLYLDLTFTGGGVLQNHLLQCLRTSSRTAGPKSVAANKDIFLSRVQHFLCYILRCVDVECHCQQEGALTSGVHRRETDYHRESNLWITHFTNWLTECVLFIWQWNTDNISSLTNKLSLQRKEPAGASSSQLKLHFVRLVTKSLKSPEEVAELWTWTLTFGSLPFAECLHPNISDYTSRALSGPAGRSPKVQNSGMEATRPIFTPHNMTWITSKFLHRDAIVLRGIVPQRITI